MVILKSLLILTIFVMTSNAQFNISGVVKDSLSGAPLTGAIVRLTNHEGVDTTKADGVFQFHGNFVKTISRQPVNINAIRLNVGIGNRLELYSPKAQRINVVVVDIRGRIVATVHEGMVRQGLSGIATPMLIPGYYFYVVTMGNNRYSAPFIVTSSNQDKAGISTAKISLLSESKAGFYGSGKQSVADNAVFTDTVNVVAWGYFQKLVAITQAIDTGLVILCRKYDSTITDIDGNVYHTVKIGTQTWLVENLKTTRYNDGTAIPLVADSNAWLNLYTPGYCWYNNDTANKATYGALYNWYVVQTGKLAPTGWRVPSDSDWTALTSSVGVGGNLKEAGLDHWRDPNSGATNRTGFSGLPGGYRNPDSRYYNIFNFGCWWSSTEFDPMNAWYRDLQNDLDYADRYHVNKNCGVSIRCVRNY